MFDSHLIIKTSLNQQFLAFTHSNKQNKQYEQQKYSFNNFNQQFTLDSPTQINHH